MDDSVIEAAASCLRDARSLIVLTGAGVSAESGVPTFRGSGGLWRNYRAEDLATPEAFARDPRLVWEWYDWRRSVLADCRPNPAHEVIAAWERRFGSFLLATQNVDGLHAAAGSERLVELHGCIWKLRCTQEGRCWEDRTVPLPEMPPRCPDCGGLARPNIVWFGEALPDGAIERVADALQQCDVFMSCGTSSVVQPAASFAVMAARRGASVIEINPEETPLSGLATVSIRAAAGQVLREIQRRIGGGTG